MNLEILSNSELGKVKAEALSNKEVKKLKNFLVSQGFQPSISKATAGKFKYEEEPGVVIQFPFKENNASAELLYTRYGNQIKQGVGIREKTSYGESTKVYEIVDGEVQHVSTITTDSQGLRSIVIDDIEFNRAEQIAGAQFSIQSTSCSVCEFLCGVIAYGGGCGLTGYFICASACAPFGTFTCPIICAVVYGAICSGGAFYNCDWMCRDLGYCS